MQEADWWSEGLGFNLCVVPFPHVCVPNFKLESLQLEVGWRLVGVHDHPFYLYLGGWRLVGVFPKDWRC